MVLTEETAVPDEALPVQGMKDHLRLGTGFADDGMQDALIVAHLRAALAVIEGRTGKVLLARRFRLRLNAWRDARDGQALPVAPVVSVLSLTVIDGAGGALAINPARWRLVQDMARPRLMGLGGLPSIPEGGVAEIVFDAGFGGDWSAIPGDLAQAVMLLAAEFYERRHEGGQGVVALPMTVQALIERWRTVRLLGRGRI